ncbi:MAG: nucleoside-triphosphatase [Lentimicrobium sp.]|nr:nucleoside-triphosphatase [Lentimicrobium sp.]
MRGLYIITGEQGSGKSEMNQAICTGLKSTGKNVSGIYARGIWENGERSGFVIESILTGESMVLCENKFHPGWKQFRKYWFNPDAFITGNLWLTKAIECNAEVIMVDEIGPLELKGEGWAENLPGIFAQSFKRIVIVSIRPSLTKEIISTFRLQPIRIIDASEDIQQVINEITKNKIG